MSSGINQNATSCKTGSVAAPRAVPPLGQCRPPSRGPTGTPRCRGAGPGPACPVPCVELAPAACSGLLHWAGCPCHGEGSLCTLPCSGSREWDGFLGCHAWPLYLSPGSSPVTLIAGNLFNCQKYQGSVLPSVPGEVVPHEQEAGKRVPLVLHPLVASAAPGALGSPGRQPSSPGDASPRRGGVGWEQRVPVEPGLTARAQQQCWGTGGEP